MISKVSNFSTFHPIGYEATTPNGNKYKKSNIWKTVAVAEIAATYAIPAFIKNPDIKYAAESLLVTPNYMYKGLESYIKKGIPKNYKLPLLIAFGIFNAVMTFGGGLLMDKWTNKKRIEKADQLNAKA